MLKVLYIHCKIKMNTTKKTNTLFDLNLRNLDIPVTDVTSIIIDQTQNLSDSVTETVLSSDKCRKPPLFFTRELLIYVFLSGI